ncbi:hypothetical protein FNV43_RR08923 [Rhamnella rubrinervis]|uniref:Uncharacterized protein n=1 Tax=Rhamnella rubrinervis TaxID=2594499 RepID=A0A8K0H9J0_9ROSA|nr:hypothetical protein FNV43_RR08923 [Rhamnella rubrinervis]
MDYTLPIAKRTRSRYDQFYIDYSRKIKEERQKEKNNVGESVSDNADQPRRGKEKKQVEEGEEGNGSDCDMDCESIARCEEASVENSENVTNSQTGFGGVDDSSIIDDENSTEEEGGEHEEHDSVGPTESQSLQFMEREGEDVEGSEVTKGGTDQRVKVGVKRKKRCELEILVDSVSENYNEIDVIDEDYSNSARDFSCVAKRTRSHFNLTSEKKEAVEHGSASRSSSESDDSSDNDNDYETIQSDDSSDDDFVDETNDSNEVDGDETNHRVQKNLHHRRKAGLEDKIEADSDEDYPDVWKNGFDRSFKKKSKGLEGDGMKLRKPSKKKRIYVKNKYDVSKILLDSIFESGAGLEELVSKRKFPPGAEINPHGDEVTLPLKFTFLDKQPSSPEISDFDRELNALWADLEFALRSSEIGSSQQVEDEDSFPPEREVDRATLCSQGKHEPVLDEEIGLRCRHCGCVELEIKYIVAPFNKHPCGKSDARDFDTYDQSSFYDLQDQDYDFDSHSDYGSYAHGDGTVWDLIPGVKGSMFPHQREGFEFLWNKIAGGIDLETLRNSTSSEGGGGCIISHDPGTGKTRLTITFLQTYMKVYPKCKPLIIAPASMLLAWEDEFQKWKVNIPFHNFSKPEFSGKENEVAVNLVLGGGQDLTVDAIRRVKVYSWCHDGGILGISYQMFEQLVGERGKSEGKRGRKCDNARCEKSREMDDDLREKDRRALLECPGLIVLDEGHTPRNEDSLIWKAVLKIKTNKRILLSGTIFQNNFKELYNTMRLVTPDFVEKFKGRCKENSGDKFVHRRQWARLTSSIGKAANDNMEYANLKVVKSMIDPLVHLHNGTVLRGLPGMMNVVVILKPDGLQKLVLQKIDIEKNNTYFKKQFDLTLASVHPSLLLIKAEDLTVSRHQLERHRLNPNVGVKTKFLVELLRLSEALNERVLVFSQYLDPLYFIKDQLKLHFNWSEEKEIFWMDGKCDQNQRHSSIKLFNDPSSEARVLLASIKACSEGINLVGASRVVFLDVVWNPSVDRQAVSRAFRLGQKRFVYTYHLIASETNEEEKYSRQAEKDRLSKLLFSSSHKAKDHQQKVTPTASEDKILEEMVQHVKLKKMFEKIVQMSNLTKRTKKAGIVGKYGTRYGASLRKQIKKMEVSQHSKYFCEFCGKFAVKRKAVGIWGCKDCGKVKAGGAYTLNTASAVTVRSTIRRLREQTES